MTSLFQILMLLLDVAFFIVIAHVILSWLINFGVLNLRQPIVAQIWDGLNRLLEPVYGPIRRALPNMGGLDLAPLSSSSDLRARIILTNNAGFFLSVGERGLRAPDLGHPCIPAAGRAVEVVGHRFPARAEACEDQVVRAVVILVVVLGG
jgi:YggT family protein